MSLPKAYNRRIMDAIGARAVWQPGSARSLGAIVARREPGVFVQVGDLSEHGIEFAQAPSQERSLDLTSAGASQRIFQAGAELAGADQLDASGEAELRIDLSAKFEFVLKAPRLIGTHITNLAAVADKAARAPGWDFDAFCIVNELYMAGSFSFVGTMSRASSISFKGKGSAVSAFVKGGVDLGLSSTGNVELGIIGQGGLIAMGLARIRKNGDINFDI